MKKGFLFVHVINPINAFTDQACAILISHLVNKCIFNMHSNMIYNISAFLAMTAKAKWFAHFGTCIRMTILWLDFFYYYTLKRQVYIVFMHFHPRFREKKAKMMKLRQESTPVSIAFSHSTFWGEGVSVHRFHPFYMVRFFVIDLFLTLITTFQVEIWPISCLNERKFRSR